MCSTYLPPGPLADLLRANARGWYPTEAATELLIGHGTWLHRTDFHDACVWFGTDQADVPARIAGQHEHDPDLRAGVHWDRIPDFLDHDAEYYSGSEGRILSVAAELAGTSSGLPLADLLASLDDTNSRLVIEAVAHARGLRVVRLELERRR